MKDRLINLAKIVVTLALLAVIAFAVDLGQVWRSLATARWGDLLVALALYQVGIPIRAYRWQALLRAQGVRVPLLKLVNLYYVGTFFNSFLPSGFGGDVVKMYELSRHGSTSAASISSVLVDRLIGLLVLFAMALVALPFSWRLVGPEVIIVLLGLVGGSALGLGLFFLLRPSEGKPVRTGLLGKLLANQKVASLHASFYQYDRPGIVRAAVASLLFNICLILVQVCIGRAVGVAISPGYFAMFVPILSALLVLPISISGFGVREGGYVVLFGQAGVAADTAVAMSLLFYALNLATGLVGGVLYAWQGMSGYRAEKRPSPSAPDAPLGPGQSQEEALHEKQA